MLLSLDFKFKVVEHSLRLVTHIFQIVIVCLKFADFLINFVQFLVLALDQLKRDFSDVLVANFYDYRLKFFKSLVFPELNFL